MSTTRKSSVAIALGDAIERLERAERALAIISYMDAQRGEDALKMRAIATDVTMWDRPGSMWWYGKDYGPAVTSPVGDSK